MKKITLEETYFYDNSDESTNKSFEKDINTFVEQYKSDKQDSLNSQQSTTQTKEGNKNKTKTNEVKKIMDYDLIKNYLVEGKLPIKKFKNSNNFVHKSVFPEKMRKYLEKIKIEFTLTPEKVNEKIPDFTSLFQTSYNTNYRLV